MLIQNNKEKIIIIDFGSQVTKLIARRIRDLGVFSEILTIKEFNKIKNFKSIKGIILSGGPSTVTKKNFLKIPKNIMLNKIPILGICYGLQLITKLLGGKIKTSKKKKRIRQSFPFQKEKIFINKKFFQ